MTLWPCSARTVVPGTSRPIDPLRSISSAGFALPAVRNAGLSGAVRGCPFDLLAEAPVESAQMFMRTC